jgi:tetratricopeptide (TPR) repeat protein
MTIVVSGEPSFLDIEPWEQKIRSVFGGDFYVGLRRVSRLVDELDAIGDEAGEAMEQGDYRCASQVLRALLEVCATEGFEAVDDSYGILGDFYRACLEDYQHALEGWAFDRPAFFADALNLYLTEDYGFSDETIALMSHFCRTDEEHDTLERLALEARDGLKGRDAYKHQKVIDLLLKLYDQRGDDEAYLATCDEKEAAGWQRWVWKAERLEALGRVDEAIAVYQEGLQHTRNQRFLVEKLSALEQGYGRPESALETMIAQFGPHVWRSDYDRIRALAQSLGRWDEPLREKLLAAFVEHGHPPEVVSLLLEEGRVAQALRIVKTLPPGAYYAHQSRMQVAAAVSDEDPRAAIELYHAALAPYLSKTGRRNYGHITRYLRLMRPLYQRLGTLDEWQAIVDDLRRRYPGRKVLMRMLDAL